MIKNIRRKLIEVALPLEAISRESAREKSIRVGHPSTLHLWWSRKPLATCRAVLFASLIDDPSSNPDKFPTEDAQNAERDRLFSLIEDLIKWENINNEALWAAVRSEIISHTNGNPPVILDPFCGGGSVPLEAVRLGLDAHGSDLNPVAVLLTKALIEIPQRFAKKPAITGSGKLPLSGAMVGAAGLASDVLAYGDWIREEAFKRIGHLYPKIRVNQEQGNHEAVVIAWLWLRTLVCPNPACGILMPLTNKFALSTKKGSECWVEPTIDSKRKRVDYKIKRGPGKIPGGTVNRKGAVCVACQTPVAFDHIRSEGRQGKLGTQLMAIVAEGSKGRIYLEPDAQHEEIAVNAPVSGAPDTDLPDQALGFRVQRYGFRSHSSLFTARQLVVLTTLSDLILEVQKKVIDDALAAGFDSNTIPLSDGGSGAFAYAEAVTTYLALCLGKAANLGSSLSSWMSDRGAMRETFARQTLSMVWDFAEANPFSASGGNFRMFVSKASEVIRHVPTNGHGVAYQANAMNAPSEELHYLVSTDPPYYDNIGYADLSDFFYVWLRRCVGKVYPDIFNTLLVPKDDELVANPHRFENSQHKAKEFFELGLEKVFSWMAKGTDTQYPMTVYYAFKQSETDSDDGEADESANPQGLVSSTGWEAMLEGLIKAGFEISGTWPMRTESPGRARALASNAVASSIVLVCRRRESAALKLSRREFVSFLKKDLPRALRNLQHGGIAPVDLAQAAIGPGMSIYSRYSDVVEADGSRLTVRKALQLINQALDEVLSEQDSDYDPDTRWAISWFEQHAFEPGLFGAAEVLSKAKDTSLNGLVTAGIIESRTGKVRLLNRQELDTDWNPATDKRLTVWEITHHLIRSLEHGGTASAGSILHAVGSHAETALELAYRLYGICERKKWAQDALAYNSLVVSWSEIKAASLQILPGPKQLLTSEI